MTLCALSSNSAIFSQLYLICFLACIQNSSFQWLYFLFLELPIIFLICGVWVCGICLVIFYNLMFLAHVLWSLHNFFKYFIWSYCRVCFQQFQYLKSLRIKVYCLLFLLILTNGFGHLGFHSHTNDLNLWEYLGYKLALISPQEGSVSASVEILGMPPIWDHFSPLKVNKPTLPCLEALHWIGYLLPLKCVYHPSL